MQDTVRRKAAEREAQVSVDTLRRLLRYDRESGALTWLPRTKEWFGNTSYRDAQGCCNNWNSLHAGRRAGHYSKARGYLEVRILGTSFLGHRVAWALETGKWPTAEIDHVDGNTSNNSWVNLREADRQANMKNRCRGRHNTSGVVGVSALRSRRKGRWRAYITSSGKTITRDFSLTESGFAEAVAWRKSMEPKFDFHENHGRHPA